MMKKKITNQVKMKIIILILTVPATAAISGDDCDACINQQCYYKTLIHEAPDNVTLVNVLAVDYTAKIIYCEFQPNYLAPSLEETFIGYWDTFYKTLLNVAYTGELYSVTVDQKSHDVYAACSKGNLKFNPDNSSPIPDITDLFLIAAGHINNVQYQNKLYLSYEGWQGLYTYGKNILSTVFRKYFLEEFVIDKNHDVYFKNNYELMYTFNSKALNVTRFSTGNITEDFRLSVDQNGDVYFNTDKYLYKVINQQAVEIGYFGLGKLFKPVFDWNNNILFADSNKLYFLKRSGSPCRFYSGQIWHYENKCFSKCRDGNCYNVCPFGRVRLTDPAIFKLKTS